MLKSRIRRDESEKEIKINIEIDGYEDHTYNEVVTYIHGELRKNLSQYVRDPKKVDAIYSTAHECMSYARINDYLDDVFMIVSRDFWKVTAKRYGEDYDVEVELKKKNK